MASPQQRRNDQPSRRIRWTCHRKGGRAYAVVRRVHLGEESYFDDLARGCEVVGVQVGKEAETAYIRHTGAIDVSFCSLSSY